MMAPRSSKVFKYPLMDTGGPIAVDIPVGARIIHSAMQHGWPTVWAIVDETAKTETRKFYIVGTGHELPREIALQFVGTVMDDPFIWHIFEEARLVDQLRGIL